MYVAGNIYVVMTRMSVQVFYYEKYKHHFNKASKPHNLRRISAIFVFNVEDLFGIKFASQWVI